jgi:hypothetical protein
VKPSSNVFRFRVIARGGLVFGNSVLGAPRAHAFRRLLRRCLSATPFEHDVGPSSLRRKTAGPRRKGRPASFSIPDLEAEARCLLEEARANTQRFAAAVMSDTATRRRYLSELNRLPANHVWFDCVAHPSLTYLWKREQ